MDINMRGHTEYKGYTAQQRDNFSDIISNFIQDIKPARVLEIGTAGGGFILCVRESLDNIGLNYVPIKTFDVVECPYYPNLREKNIEINIENLFDHSYTKLIKKEKIVPYIQEPGITVVFCDGGHKIGEFNSIAPYLKRGDFILAHDYIDTWENYQNLFKNQIWDWCEVEEKYIEKISTEYNLKFYNQDIFKNIVWVCKIKK
jgi:cephalosporin hydroxylase